MLGFGKKKKNSTSLDRYELPSFSAALLNLLNKLRDPTIGINELAADLEIDPGLHVRVLKTVNSAAFGLSHKVSNIRHAVNLLGRSRLESLVLAVAVKDGVSRTSPPWLNMQQFWSTAAYRASLARGLADKLHPQGQGDLFTIGLLQDMAVPILAGREGNRYRDIYLNWLEQDDFKLTEQENRHCGIDHAALGADMAKSWGFPAALAEALGGHHTQKDSDNILLAIKVAALVKQPPDNDSSAKLVAEVQQRFGIAPEMLATQIEIAQAESRELSAALN
jgi:HD-like signal output (HDOD) protein